MRLSAIIVVFQPEISELCKNIHLVIEHVDKVIIYQNSNVFENLKNFPEFINIPQKEKLVFLGKNRNVGIATALNEGVKWSLSNNFTHVLTLDQDSYFKKGHLTKYLFLIKQLKLDNIGVYGINPSNWGHLLYEASEDYLEVADTITSGSIFPLEVFEKHGFFEDDLFIDAVDYEFCYRLKTLGLKTIVFPSIILEHKVGNATKTWLGFKTDNYSAFRTYYIIRNQIIIWKRYPAMFPYKYKITLIKGHIFSRIVKIIFAEKDKLSKISSMVRGLYDGVKGRIENNKA